VSTELEICNTALILLGVEPVSSLADNVKAARYCTAIYSRIRDQLIASHYWNFAMKRAALVDSGTSPEFGFTYAYNLPADYLRVRSLNENVEFKVENGKLITDLSDAKLEYIYKVTDTSKFTQFFEEALIYKLAASLAFPLVQGITLATNLHDLAERKLRDARSFDGQEGTSDLLQDDEWLNARTTSFNVGNVVV